MKKETLIHRDLIRGRISRREALIGLAALGLSATAAADLLARPAHAAEPKRGGRLKLGFAVGSPNDTLDPHRSSTAMDQCMVANMHNRLVSIAPDLEPKPELALSWEPNATADDWVLKLRSGVEFHDGRSFTARDAAYSIMRMIDPQTASPAAAILTDIDPAGVVPEDDETLRIRLVRSNADLPSLLADTHACMIPDGHKDFTQETAVGTGPFMIEDFSPGRRVLYKRNPNYWGEGLPYADELENIPIPDQSARASALLAGEIHLLEGVDPSTIDTFDRSPDIQLISTPSGAHRVLPMHIDAAPFNDNRVRLALKLLVDRQQMIDVIHKGHAKLGNDHPISPIDRFYCSELPQRQPDPDRAKHLLREAGAEGITFDLSTAPVITGVLECALLLAEQAAKAGVTINVIREPNDSYWESVWLKKPWCVSEWNMRPVPDMMFSMAYTKDAPWNESHFKNETFEKLLVEARVTTDFAKRRELYCEMQKMLSDEGGTIVPYFLNLLDATQVNIHGVVQNPMGPFGQWRMETIWIDA